MIATGLTFLFGVLVTTLLAILVAPLVWGKAQSLAKRDYEATIPTSANEIRAGFDAVRAEAAMSVRRQEILAAKANEKSARTQAELGRGTVENVELLKRIRALGTTLEERHTEIAGLKSQLAEATRRNEQLSAELEASGQGASLNAEEFEAMSARLLELGEVAEERKIQLIAAEAKLDRFADDDRTTERGEREARAAIDRLRDEAAAAVRTSAEEKAEAAQLRLELGSAISELAARQREIAELQQQLAAVAAATVESVAEDSVPAPEDAAENSLPSGKPTSAGQRLRAALERKSGTGTPPSIEPTTAIGNTDVREAISDLAARVIRMVAAAEGPSSPLAPILQTEVPGSATGQRTLAERVALLVDADAASPQAPVARPE